MKIFAKRLKELRIMKNLSQRDLAKETGFTQAAIAYWENATRVPAATAVVVFAKYFGVTADYLLGLED